MQHKSRAFTLIELLVVVLIIGILAAIAVPQYQVAVMKSRFAQMRSVASSYVHAAEVYHMETGEWPTELSVFPFELPGERKTPTSSDCVQNKDMYCCLLKEKNNYQESGITCGDIDYQFAYQYNSFLWKGQRCTAKTATSAEQMCKSVTGDSTGDDTNLATPTGHQTGYKRFSF